MSKHDMGRLVEYRNYFLEVSKLETSESVNDN